METKQAGVQWCGATVVIFDRDTLQEVGFVPVRNGANLVKKVVAKATGLGYTVGVVNGRLMLG